MSKLSTNNFLESVKVESSDTGNGDMEMVFALTRLHSGHLKITLWFQAARKVSAKLLMVFSHIFHYLRVVLI